MKDGEALKKHRLFYILIGVIGLLAVLNIRLFWIQVAASRNWTEHGIDLVENSVIQREKGIVLDSGRGDFYDRSGKALTGRETQVLTVFPVRKEASLKDGEINATIARILQVAEPVWTSFVESLKAPQVWAVEGKHIPLNDAQIAQITALGLPQLTVSRLKERYDNVQTASHVIGFISQDPERISRQYTNQIHQGELQLTSRIGGAGLERTFDPWLQGIGATSVSLFTDALKRPLPGLDARIVTPRNDYYPVKVMTTLDATIQLKIEKAMAKLQIKEGAVVVLDAANADVIAMASRPEFNPQHIDLQNGAWANRALKATAPGSIFKTVTAAAALEEHVAKPDEMFECNGVLGKYGLTCWNKQGHGRISFREGYAESCNIVFAKIAERLKGVSLDNYANRLGLNVEVGWQGEFMQDAHFKELDGEEKGQIFADSTPREDGGVRAQSAIGQRDVMITPLQAANMVVTLLQKGKVLSPRIVKEVRFQNGRLMEAFDEKSVKGLSNSISSGTAARLLSWMNDVVDHGTGTALRSAKWPIAGKSGTAQTADKEGVPQVNQWFIGYGPVKQPRYAAAVMVQNMPETSASKSLPLFKEVMDILATAQ
ncbi:peptidoglycan D,D-transpeptidase FtsI family protein [Paenibacillus radicis (ex Xue et al. 2023)]|uniref:Penicillin-binding protein 2 n=1 Tax=Paenibacillus radicis (ex Xue et al. 2023) TaxID=2972489 RepID=A0ABT1YLQ2_9BACL|nr:penicillin-binding protein 2 [Paenibacillus radicis (ex Xue et al. 2023)]MCR8634117.1 penicillin-binding protein 2 [Paenibacillus radicis (ex Xue et al. 2023)]